MSNALEYRTCPITGKKVFKTTQNLMWANAVTAVVFILIGGIMALLVGLTRWPAVHLLPDYLFYRFLTAHGLNMLIFWIIFFEIAGLYFGSSVLLNVRLAAPKTAWFAYILMLGGAILVDIMVFTGRADVMFSSYIPLQAHPLYYLGIILFAVGALIGCGIFFGTWAIARAEKTYEGSVPLVTFGLAAAAIIAVYTLACGAIIYIPTFLWSLGIIKNIDAAMYRLIFWGLGHSSQQINVTAMVSVWYLLATLTVGAQTVNEKVCRTAFVLYIFFINLAAEHHLLTDPTLSSSHKVFNTGYFVYMAVLASMIHALAIPMTAEVALRRKGYRKGIFEWLTKAPWGEPGFPAMLFSLFIFGFIGGITGVVYGTEQLSIKSHNTWALTGHFHGTVVGGTTLAFMGLTYYVIPLIFRREIIGKKLATAQPYIFAIGIILLAIGMGGAGTLGSPRRHWDITFADSIIPFSFDPAVILFTTIAAIGILTAVTGGIIYVGVSVLSVFFGRKLAPDEAKCF
ncbi:MAG: cbb3-type cytochrome c oxidase subunit I [Nitrospinota bacterium]